MAWYGRMRSLFHSGQFSREPRAAFVWIIDQEGKAEFHPIKVGPWHGEEWFVDEGLEGGETVVVNGALKLRAGVVVKIVEAEEKKAETEAGESTK